MPKVRSTEIADVKIIEWESFVDARGSFREIYNRQTLSKCGIELNFVQDNESLSKQAGTVRGLHYQSPPAAQDKMVRVVRGSIFDVAVDLRRSSPTYGKWVAETLSEGDGKQLFIPGGFAHGFCTLEPDTHVIYKVTNYYSPENEAGVTWDDPDLAIEWPISSGASVLSEKDARLPRFRSLRPVFE